jgi:hypothetical protein
MVCSWVPITKYINKMAYLQEKFTFSVAKPSYSKLDSLLKIKTAGDLESGDRLFYQRKPSSSTNPTWWKG